MNEKIKGVPNGSYCYGYVPGIDSHQDLDPLEDLLELRRYCKYWNPTEHGFVECKYLNRKALWIVTTQEVVNKAVEFFGSENEMEKQITGFLLGDAVKECDLNRDGPDFIVDT